MVCAIVKKIGLGIKRKEILRGFKTPVLKELIANWSKESEWVSEFILPSQKII